MYLHDEKILGLEIKDLIKIKTKLNLLNIDLKDLITFLDRNEIQLFAEMRSEIKCLENKIEKIKKVLVSATNEIENESETIENLDDKMMDLIAEIECHNAAEKEKIPVWVADKLRRIMGK